MSNSDLGERLPGLVSQLVYELGWKVETTSRCGRSRHATVWDPPCAGGARAYGSTTTRMRAKEVESICMI